MEKPLKAQNAPKLALVISLNAVAYMTVPSEGFTLEAWTETLTSIQKLSLVLPVTILTSIINAFLAL